MLFRSKELYFKDGDKILTLSCGFPTTVNPIIQNNLIPVFVDISLEDLMKEVQKNYKKWQELAKRQRYFVNSTFTKNAVAAVYESVLNTIDTAISSVPKHVALNLPKLNKTTEAPKLTLPKLKKIEA